MTARILIVDDDRDLLAAFSRMLGGEAYEVVTAGSAEQALSLLEGSSFELVLTDLSMPKMSGLEMLTHMRQRGDATPTLVISGEGSIENAVRAIKLGALDFLEKPLHRERLVLTVQNALRYAQLQEAHGRLQADLVGDNPMVGAGPAMQRLAGLIARVAPSEGRVLITGENGTGKELVAAAIHAGSPRKDGPFVKLNCGAVPKDLVESELFGHEKGAFTGAVVSRRGRFELADGGTLMLDEIGDMPMPMQVKLLRVLQEGAFERVGGARTIKVNVRVLAATNRDLSAMVREGAFREDLYYRLNVVALHVPPLRDRKEDLPALVAAFTAHGKKGYGVTLGGDAVAALSEYDFPGNVRELENVVERLAILYAGETVSAATVREMLSTATPAHAASGADAPVPPGAVYEAGKSLRDLLHDLERRIMVEAIAANGNRKSAAAQALSSERSHFYKKCRQYGIGGADD